MKAKKKIIIIGAAILLVFATAVSIFLGFYYQPVPKNLPFGISADLRPLRGAEGKGLEAMFFKHTDGGLLPFVMTQPNDIKEGEKYPVVIFLHGWGEYGSDNRKQFKWNKELNENLKDAECFAFYPQAPKNMGWGYEGG